MAAVREIAAGGETRVLVGMPPVDQAPVAERHWFLRVLPTLQWLVLGILVLVTAIFYEDVNAMRLAARARREVRTGRCEGGGAGLESDEGRGSRA